MSDEKLAIVLGVVALSVFILCLFHDNTLNYFEEQRSFQYDIMRNLNSTITKSRMRALFDRNYDYKELVKWTHSQLTFSDYKPDPPPTDPFDIMKLEYGRCGEFSILYASACLAHGYNARLVLILKGSDHEWVEVKIDDEWVHVDPTNPPFIHIDDPEMYARHHKNLCLVVAFMEDRYEIVTDKYNPQPLQLAQYWFYHILSEDLGLFNPTTSPQFSGEKED